jgi:hypothetical protein
MQTVVRAEYAGDYRVELWFSDGLHATIDLEQELWGEMFEPLKNKEIFKQVRADRELSTIVWPNGADLAPEFLYNEALKALQKKTLVEH